MTTDASADNSGATSGVPDPLDPEDHKLVVLARATRARTGALEGAALRDLDGRTYAAATVHLPSLQVSAIGVVISMAVASGAKGAEAVVLLTGGEVRTEDRAALADFSGPGVRLLVGTETGSLHSCLTG